MVRISLHVAAISPIVFVCCSFVESGAHVPSVVVLSDERVPDVVVISGVRVPNVVVISGARVPNGVVLPGVRIRAARGFRWLVLAHRGWVKFKIRP